MQNDLFRGKDHVLSKDDIRIFLVGVFTDYKTFFYDNDFLGIMTNEGTPVFISVTNAKVADHQQVLSHKLGAIAAKYVVDYTRNELRRRATFTSLAYDPEESNGFSLSKFTSFGIHKDAFENCVRESSRLRRSATISCFHQEDDEEKEVIKFVPLQNTELESSIEDGRSYYQTFKDKMQPSLDIVGKFSKILMAGEIFKDIVSALIRADYKSFAVNVAFLASGPLMEVLSTRMVASGYRSLLVTAPFLCRLPMMAFVGYDLFEQIEDYKAGNLDAKVNIVGDASILAIEFTTASIEGAESLGLVAGVSETLGPIGLAVGTAIFIGTDIYSSVKTVNKIDHIVHLTSWQKFATGFLSFLHLPPTKTVQQEMMIESIVSAATKNAANFFAQHPQVRYYIFPSYRDDGNFMENNSVNFSTGDFANIIEMKMICVDEYFQVKYYRHIGHNFHCHNMLGFESTSNDTKTFIMLGTGIDTATAFPDSSTTFLIGNGFKYIAGSEKSDIFILNGSDIHGHLDGHSGDDIINLANFATGQNLQVNLNHDITYNNGSINIKNIANLIGRGNVQDIVQCVCETRYLDLQGGSNSTFNDKVMIPFSPNCSYNMRVEISGFFYLENDANVGYFLYSLSKSHEVIIRLTRKSKMTNLFSFCNNIDNLDLIRVGFNNSGSISLYNLLIKTNSSSLEIEGIDDNAVYSFEDDAQLRVVNGTVTVNMVSNETIENIYTRGLKLSRRLNAVVNVWSLTHNTSILFGGGSALINNSSNEISHINMLPSDPYHATYLVGGERQNIFRISVPDFHHLSAPLSNSVNMVKILNYANKNHPSILDLYEIVFLVHEKFHGKVNISIERQGVNLHMQIEAVLQKQNISLVNVTLDKAYENNAYQHILINMHRPMRISITENKTVLMPLDYHVKNISHALIHAGMIDPFTTIVSTKNIYDYETFIHENSTLVLTNVNGIFDNKDLIFIVFKDLLIDVELQTLRVTFADRTVSFLDHIDEILRESDDFEEVF
uniref:Uncharacterized protein n=1 Tax=Romanomermis culicivorax TaxID=13658 RepID=A0A915KW51_ROMCU